MKTQTTVFLSNLSIKFQQTIIISTTGEQAKIIEQKPSKQFLTNKKRLQEIPVKLNH